MNWLKVGAVVIGGIVVFFVVDSVVHILLGFLTAIAFVAIVAGGGYIAYKVMGSRRRREVRDRPEKQRPRRAVETTDIVVPPAPPQPMAPRSSAGDVEDDLARLKREMGR